MCLVGAIIEAKRLDLTGKSALEIKRGGLFIILYCIQEAIRKRSKDAMQVYEVWSCWS